MFCTVLLCACSVAVQAQLPAPVEGAPPSSAQPGTLAERPADEIVPPAPVQPKPAQPADPVDHRIFGVVPNFKTVNNPNEPITPIGPAEKFGLVLHYFDPFTFGFTALQSGIQQATGAQKEYGQGVLGYTKRYGMNFTDAFTNELFTVGVFPSLLHEDPRYFRKGSGSGLSRTGYALTRIFITHSDSGRARYNFSEVMGNLTSGAISTAYYPRADRGFGDIVTRMGFQIGYDSLFNVMKEFYPDLKRKLSKKSR